MHFVLLLCVSCALFCYVLAVTKEQEKDFIRDIEDCEDANPLTVTDLENIMEKREINSSASKCLFACIFKKLGMMNEDGLFLPEGVRAFSLKYYTGYEAKIKSSEDFANACSSVNDEPVEDGVKGCERAALLFKCSSEKTPEFDFLKAS